MLSSLTRLIPLLLMLAFVAPSVASAKNVREQCEEGVRCESSMTARDDSAMETARHRPTGPQRRVETNERAPHAPARVSPASPKAPNERERTASRLADASGDSPLPSASTPVASTTEPSGLGPWARVLAIVMAAAGVLSLIVARMADA
jgi:hypothetical protein